MKKIILGIIIPLLLISGVGYYWGSDYLIRKNEAEFGGKRGELITFIERTKIGISERNEQLKTLKSTDFETKTRIEEELRSVYELQANYTEYLKNTPIPDTLIFKNKKEQTYIFLALITLFGYLLGAWYMLLKKPKMQTPTN